MKEYATSRVANLLPHLGYRFIHALEASPVHRRQTFQGKALQVNLRGLDRRMPQQLTDHLDRYVLFLQGRGERVTDRVRGDRLTHTTSLRQRPQVAVKAQQGAVVFRIGRLTRFLPAQKREQVRRVLVRANRQLIQQEPYIGRDLHPDERPALLTVVRQDPVLDILFPQMGEIHERHPAEREHQAKTQLGSPHLRLTDEQKQEFNALFADLFFRSGLANDNEMSSSIARLAVNTCRIMAEIAMMRALECDQPYQFKGSSAPLLTPDKEIAADNIKDGIITRWDMTITAEDFHAVLELVTPLYRHATHILSFLPSTEVKHRANADRDALFEIMGNQFTRTQLLEQAEKMKIKPNTALSWLNRLIKKGLLINTDDKGVYTRTHVCVC